MMCLKMNSEGNYDAYFIAKNEDKDFHVKYSYPDNPDYDVAVFLERINFDEEKEKDLKSGKGFIISSPKPTLKKEIKNPNGIFSTRFGQRLGDQNPFMDRYSCECGELKSAINNGLVCPKCHKICKFVDDDFSMFGWIEIDPEYAIINPDMYKQLDIFFGRSTKKINNKKNKTGSLLYNMLEFDKEMDQDGNIVGPKTVANEPFYGIGMIEFQQRFDEIMDYYLAKKGAKKQEVYDDIMHDRDKLFIHSIPVFTTLLRPTDIVSNTLYYEKVNGYYNMIVKLAYSVNKNKRKIDRTPRIKNLQLFKLQQKYMVLYDEIVEILNGKKGELRNLVSGRFNFTSRSVIRQNPELRIDQVELPYVELVITQQQRIINILHRMLNISYQEAYDKWFVSISKIDPTVVSILCDLIHATPEGLPVLINRNPTISYGSIMQCFCVGINFNFTMTLSLQVLPPLAADFDGDTLNIMHIINQNFFERAYEVFNPRNAMYISRKDGMLNHDVLPQKDTLVNANTLNYLTLNDYTEEEMNHIKKIKELAASM